MLPTRIKYFLISGAGGFLVDSSILLLMTELLGFSPFEGRSVSLPASIVATWLFNRHLTFNDRKSNKIIHEFFKFLISSSAGLVVNITIYILLVNSIHSFYETPIIALSIAVISAMIFNFISYNYFVFKKHEEP